jgi:hypothetical protein
LQTCLCSRPDGPSFLGAARGNRSCREKALGTSATVLRLLQRNVGFRLGEQSAVAGCGRTGPATWCVLRRAPATAGLYAAEETALQRLKALVHRGNADSWRYSQQEIGRTHAARTPYGAGGSPLNERRCRTWMRFVRKACPRRASGWCGRALRRRPAQGVWRQTSRARR